MLAVVQPFSPSPDVAHRVRSNVSPSNPTTTRPSASTILASNPPPSLQRHQTAPATVPTRKQASPKHPVTSTDPSLSSSLSSTSSSSTTTSGTETEKPAFDIHSYPATDLLKLLALLLTHIATTNDRLSPSQPAPPPPAEAPPIWHTLTTASRNAISTPAATLTFHARNIPTISLEAYLLRILKYCPTTNHVFLSLLVYFERMSKLSNDAVGRAFVIDSYNIHRLVIAGVTVASKFFSDVFYTNSRYAKVGGLPLPELNQLELQFLLLNDFRLVISSSEMQHYAEQLIQVSSMSLPLSLPNIANPTTTTNGHSPRLHRQPSTPFSHAPPPPHPQASTSSAATSDSSSTVTEGSNTTLSHQPYQTYSQPRLTKPAPSHAHVRSPTSPTRPSASASTSSSSASSSSYLTSSSPAGPLDALGGVPAPVHNPAHHPPGVPHTHPPHSYQHAHPVEYAPQQVELRGQVHQRYMRERYGEQQQQQGKTPVVGAAYGFGTPSSSRSENAHTGAGEVLKQQLREALADADAQREGVQQEEEEDEVDADADADADASTDCGTETSTDEEPTIRAPGTVVGGGGSVNGSVWGDEEDREDVGMRSP